MWWILLALLPTAPGPAVVVPTPGGPQLQIDGQPRPLRVFWGQRVGGSVAVGTAWQPLGFDVTPRIPPVGRCTLHFRFGAGAGSLELRNLRITDPAGQDVFPAGSLADAAAFGRSWLVWPLGDQNTVGRWSFGEGALRIELRDPPGGQWPDFHFHSAAKLELQPRVKYRVSFEARASAARSLNLALFDVANSTWRQIGAPPGYFLSQVKLAQQAGVDIVSFSAPNCWGPPEEPANWQPLDDLCEEILEVNPQALLIPRVGADAPDWYLNRHLEARMVFEDGRAVQRSVVTDRAYRAAAAAQLERIGRHLAERFPRQVIGLHPCGQNTGEWFYAETWGRPLSGYDPATAAAWREYLRATGAADWQTASVPPATERHGAPLGLLRDPVREARLVAFNRFWQREMGDTVLALAAATRRGLGAGRLVVFFYGYGWEFGAIGNGASVSGHYDLDRVLASPDIDVLCSPISYTDRAWLGTGPVMTAAESVAAAGKLWLNEDDTRTYLDPRQQEHAQEGGLVNLAQTQHLMRRNTAMSIVRGQGCWWMDLPGQGWFNDAAIWQVMRELAPLDQGLLRRTTPFAPDIAAVLDEASTDLLAGGSQVAARPLIYDSRAALGRVGAPYGQYLLDRLLAAPRQPRLQVMLAAWSLTAAQRQRLAARPAGVTRLWCWAPAVYGPAGQDLAAAQQVHGFALRPVTVPTAQAKATAAGLAAGLPASWGPAAAIQPLFTVSGPGEVWATWSDGSPALVVRPGEVFCGVPQLVPELLRAVASRAGVPLVTQRAAHVWTADVASDGARYLVITPFDDGPLAVDCGRDGRCSDALSGAALGGRQVTLPAEAGVTRVLLLQP
ncbi:MAG: hypothetical protein IT204_25235 [Fimbriimonadaceae bacterium]|nr:hypothetical protein [Fimbriimonadaceae bacterium]